MPLDDQKERNQGPRHCRRPDRETVRQGLDHAPRPARRDRARSSRFRPARSASTTRSASAASPAAASSRSSDRSRRARRRWRCRSSPRRRRPAAWRRSSTPSTRSTRSTRRSWASISRTCWSRSPTTASRRSRSSRCSIRSNGVDVVVVDSVAALVPQGGDRRRDGRSADGPAGAPHVAGAAQAHRRRVEVEDHA